MCIIIIFLIYTIKIVFVILHYRPETSKSVLPKVTNSNLPTSSAPKVITLPILKVSCMYI